MSRLLITNGTFVTMNDQNAIVQGWMYVDGNVIAGIGAGESTLR